MEIKGTGQTTVALYHKDQTEQEINENPLNYLKQVMPKDQGLPPLPFYGGAIGYLGYDAIREFEDIVDELPDDIQMPEVHLMLYKTVIVVDHSNQVIYLVATNPENESEEVLDERLEQLLKILESELVEMEGELENLSFEPEVSEEEFK